VKGLEDTREQKAGQPGTTGQRADRWKVPAGKEKRRSGPADMMRRASTAGRTPILCKAETPTGRRTVKGSLKSQRDEQGPGVASTAVPMSSQ